MTEISNKDLLEIDGGYWKEKLCLMAGGVVGVALGAIGYATSRDAEGKLQAASTIAVGGITFVAGAVY